jgi:hypothetical protein
MTIFKCKKEDVYNFAEDVCEMKWIEKEDCHTNICENYRVSLILSSRKGNP